MEHVPDDSQAQLEALFLFSGSGLYVQGAVLGQRLAVICDATPVTIILPGIEDFPPDPGQLSHRAGSTKAAHPASWNPQRGEIHAAYVATFEVRVGVEPGDGPTQALVEHAFPLGVEVAERFLSWVRTQAGQYWLPSCHEGLESGGLYGRLVLAGTYHEVDPEARWWAGSAVVARSPSGSHQQSRRRLWPGSPAVTHSCVPSLDKPPRATA